MIGVDSSEYQIAQAKSKYGTYTNYEFYRADATKLADYPEITTNADIVILRHHQSWPLILQAALEYVHPSGLIILTSHDDRQHQDAIGILQKLNGQVIINEINPFNDNPGGKVAKDRNVAIIKRN